MAKKPASSEHIRGLLLTPNFGQSGVDLTTPGDPITNTRMVLPVKQIKPYDRNPRRERNPEYDAIKASIRAQRELTSPLTITRRPGDAEYMIQGGGNTRLQILTELYAETGDEVFNRVECLYKPWKDEATVLTSHLIENEMRGDISLIDKALALRDLQEMWQVEGQPLSQREFTQRLTEFGYKTSRRAVQRLQYASDVLHDLIPTALRSGLGSRDVDAMRAAEATCRQYWVGHQRDDAAFDALWHAALAEQDGPDFTVEAVRDFAETRMSADLAVPIHRLRLDIDALAKGIPLSIRPAGTTQPPSVSARDTHPIPTIEHDEEPDGTGDDADFDDFVEPDYSDVAVAERPPVTRDTPPQATVTRPVQETVEGERSATLSRIHNSPNDLKSLRSRAYVLARRIAQRHGIADCVVSSPKVGLGFVVDTPAHPIIPMDGPHFEATWMRQWLWWHLLLTSEYTALPERMFAFKTRLTEFFVTRRAEEYYKWVGEPNWRAQSFELFANPLLSDKDFEDWVFLMETCRRMRTAYTGTDLWGDLK